MAVRRSRGHPMARWWISESGSYCLRRGARFRQSTRPLVAAVSVESGIAPVGLQMVFLCRHTLTVGSIVLANEKRQQSNSAEQNPRVATIIAAPILIRAGCWTEWRESRLLLR